MIIEPLIPQPNSVRPMIEADRDKPDARSRRDDKKRQEHDAGDDGTNPVPNDRGQITGKLIDVLA